MFSVKLVQLVETHWEQISARILHKIQNDPRLAHVNRLSESEFRERAREILNNIGDWLGASLDEPLARRCEGLGRHRKRGAGRGVTRLGAGLRARSHHPAGLPDAGCAGRRRDHHTLRGGAR